MILEKIKQLKAYITARSRERSTWVGISIAVSAAAMLPSPWNILSFIVGVIGSLVPDGEAPHVD